MGGVPLAGSIGFGLVWGWLAAGLDGGAHGSWLFRLALAGVSLLAALTVGALAGTSAVIAAATAAALALLLRVVWHRELAVRSGNPH